MDWIFVSLMGVNLGLITVNLYIISKKIRMILLFQDMLKQDNQILYDSVANFAGHQRTMLNELKLIKLVVNRIANESGMKTDPRESEITKEEAEKMFATSQIQHREIKKRGRPKKEEYTPPAVIKVTG